MAISAGLNAYIPLLALLLVIEIVADNIPIVDSINDWLQTIVRPTAGGLAFASGSTATTSVVSDPAAFFSTNQWFPLALGVVGSLFALLIPILIPLVVPIVAWLVWWIAPRMTKRPTP